MSSLDPPSTLSRYRSVRQARNAQQAVAIAQVVPPSPLPTSTAISTVADDNLSNNTRGDEWQETPIKAQAIQRSRSRYHKQTKPNAASSRHLKNAPEPPVPALPHRSPRGRTGDNDEQSKEINGDSSTHQDDEVLTKEKTRSNLRREPERQRTAHRSPSPRSTAIAADVTDDSPESRSAPSAMIVPPQALQGSEPPNLMKSKSRYRHHAPHNPNPTPDDRTAQSRRERPALMPSKTQHDHRQAMRNLQRQASFPSQPQAKSRLLTQASLERLPDDTRPDSVAIHRRVSHAKAQGLERRRSERQPQEQIQLSVREILDADAERQRNLQAKIRSDRKRVQKARAIDIEAERKRLQVEEEQAEKTRQLEERERRLEEREHERQTKEEESRRAADALAEREARLAEAQKSVKRTGTAEPTRGRQKDVEDRSEHYRKRSLSALEGKPNSKIPTTDDAPPLPSPPPKPADSRSPLAGFLKKRLPTDATKPQSLDRSRSRKRPGEKDLKLYGGNIVPGVDAPISAVNAGERRVHVKCNKSSIHLPVTPTTTPTELIRSAANCLAESVETKASVLLESFGKVGVQRPLRNYEHIRDVMNSWDDDDQNSLILMPSATGGNDQDLEAASVSQEQPLEFSCHLHYSQKPGKWDKRWITLRSDGQVLFSKKDGHKETTNICHMTDFDIYTLEHRSKRIKPPKKICFAIKSQQKSNVFESLENFVHFFSTSDKQGASAWYRAIQGWRSWYLVNVMGEGGKASEATTSATGAPLLPETTNNHQATGSEDSHYKLGSFKPLLDMNSFGTLSDRPSSAGRGVHHDRNHSSRGGGAPSAFPKWLIDSIDAGNPSVRARNDAPGNDNFARHASVKRSPSQRRKESPAVAHDPKFNANVATNDNLFASASLLGGSYFIRQKVQADRDTAETGPFLQGGLLDTMGPSNAISGFNTAVPHSSTKQGTSPERTPAQNTNLNRSPSRRNPELNRSPSRRDPDLKRSHSCRNPTQKPLVDLNTPLPSDTPALPPPPPHHNPHQGYGGGYVPPTIGPGGLVERAN